MKAKDAREWIEHAPKAVNEPCDLIGWQFGAGGDDPQSRATEGGPWFLCSACASRLLARGCGFSSREAGPVWTGKAHSPEGCTVCAAHKAKEGDTL